MLSVFNDHIESGFFYAESISIIILGKQFPKMNTY